ncbi:amino acid synthesis family protein [Azospirillum sp. ST 5-10]|uniref:amino acid synthesis family protein n=1 Tax=unclassified Azospirillum TaxID=2630922 RepID=UPI003F4A2154
MSAPPRLRKTLLLRETVLADGDRPAARPVVRVAAVAVLENPFAGRPADDLTPLVDFGAVLGARLAGEAVALLGAPVAAYGKAAIVGAGGEVEHAAALLHPRLGQPFRAAVGGGAAIIPSTTKLGGMGMPIDVPLGHKDEVWSFDHLDAMTVFVHDAPRPGEIVAVLAVSDGGRPDPRVGNRRPEPAGPAA